MDALHPMDTTFDATVRKLRAKGLPADWYSINNADGYQILLGQQTDVRCIEVYLGPSATQKDFGCFAVAQSIFPEYPSLTLTYVVDLHLDDHHPSDQLARFSRAIDRPYSTIFLPIIFEAMNQLDPTGMRRGIVVQSYNSKMTVGDFIHGSIYSADILINYHRTGQLALIAVDYDDPLSRMIANVMRWCAPRNLALHLLPRTDIISELAVPIRNLNGGVQFTGGHSTALVNGIALACSYFDQHYASYQYKAPGSH